MQTYRITITGKTPLLMHRDDVEWADRMEEWKNDPDNKKNSKAGDDRTPAFRWLGCLYHDNNVICMPAANLARCAMEGGASVPVPGGKGGKTFKAQSQSGMGFMEPYSPLLIGGKPVPVEPLFALMNEPSFAKHRDAARQHGFDLHVKRAKVTTQKHIRVRPIFRDWSLVATVAVWDEQITHKVLTDILTYGGQYKGLGDWRPGSRTPGSYGMFNVAVEPA